jgi:hypothetical protein
VEAWPMPISIRISIEQRLVQSNKTGFVYDKSILYSFQGFDRLLKICLYINLLDWFFGLP